MIKNLNIIITITLLLSAIMVVLSSNPVQSALFLVLTYVSASVQLLLFKVEFIALVLITIYVGAIIILLLFVVLMIDIKNYLTISYFYYGIAISFIFLIETLFLIFKNFKLNTYYSNNFFLTNFFRDWILMIDTTTDIEILGQILSVNFVIHLLISGLILFLGVVSSVFLTFNFKMQKKKNQVVFRQLSKNFSKSLI